MGTQRKATSVGNDGQPGAEPCRSRTLQETPGAQLSRLKGPAKRAAEGRGSGQQGHSHPPAGIKLPPRRGVPDRLPPKVPWDRVYKTRAIRPCLSPDFAPSTRPAHLRPKSQSIKCSVTLNSLRLCFPDSCPSLFLPWAFSLQTRSTRHHREASPDSSGACAAHPRSPRGLALPSNCLWWAGAGVRVWAPEGEGA